MGLYVSNTVDAFALGGLFVAAVFFLYGLILGARQDVRGMKYTAFGLLTISILSLVLARVAVDIDSELVRNLSIAGLVFFFLSGFCYYIFLQKR
ncbi:MAG: hypothetical protein A2651_03520 [Candidatus Yanofskybacteria bacterium RIFCSPHIGHO2_01_FULL_42_12]|uniref:Uncharacterized protein n=1 Tax=Candidatus Yanofskybacteria bacterium RIFCSPLOWO2_01_FULL_42_49 TaxID=1802694 RepID=A0A1F8GDF3_9BACT|nr:MAG: hypothetical protein A2651_03520 [Candidatus Yanofskybacteria bacterium RIFCSPHIGHO2_01_FULL_42_12]OGN22489.1 MAG: hypothetical protein A2918_01865 [Candidatus Yanofskybacteria bacterium RIFCSPLOWO2_01_FULL_42_49]